MISFYLSSDWLGALLTAWVDRLPNNLDVCFRTLVK